ncbi:MAG: DUF1573 domain-containing protein [Deltaproteobacteria bacterium]|jgi:hypothetical protein|nr:DUF1573 domain-containing protein [Deltaproteobacteria bacterium]
MANIKKRIGHMIFCFLAVILVLGCVTALTADQTGEADKGDVPLPGILIDEPVFDFGSLYEGDPVLHTFVIRNKGDAGLVIEKVKPG